MNNRIISGICGVIILIAVLKFNQEFFLILNLIVGIISMLAISEIFTVMNISNIYSIYIPTLIFSGITPLLGSEIKYAFVFYVYTLYMFNIMLFKKRIKFKNIAVIYAMTLLITLSLNKIIELRNYGGIYGSFYVLLSLSISWTSDTGAYFIGKLFGKHKLCPRISPKKTIEGFFGGFIVCLISIILIVYLFNNFIFPCRRNINYFYLIILCIIGSPLSVIGDLSFSIIKRSCNVKDFGNFIPGHGGILDRFDSTIFVLPFTYFFIMFFPILF